MQFIEVSDRVGIPLLEAKQDPFRIENVLEFTSNFSCKRSLFLQRSTSFWRRSSCMAMSFDAGYCETVVDALCKSRGGRW